MIILDGYVTVLAVFYLTIVGFPVLVQSAYGKPQDVSFNVRDLGGKFSHFDAIAFFILGFPFNL